MGIVGVVVDAVLSTFITLYPFTSGIYTLLAESMILRRIVYVKWDTDVNNLRAETAWLCILQIIGTTISEAARTLSFSRFGSSMMSPKLVAAMWRGHVTHGAVT